MNNSHTNSRPSSRLRYLTMIGIIVSCISNSTAIAQPNAVQPNKKTDDITPPRDPSYKLVWSDEFNTDGAPNEANWNFEKGFTRNNEFQWYQKENATCKNGMLIIEARRETVTNPNYKNGAQNWKVNRPQANYTSASLTTIGKHQWTYGRMEIRAKFPALTGLWPALWTTGTNNRWPLSGEIDIMEYYNHGILANFCWAGPRGKAKWDTAFHKMEEFDEKQWNNSFHTWVLEWTKDKISIYLDGKLLNDIDMKTPINEHGQAINPFNSPQAFRVNMAIGGDKGGDPSKTTFPQRYEIDYIRVFQKP
ncbi:MAG: glycoside hydrolase family 16 protein [Akkermansiaceae bacterium]